MTNPHDQPEPSPRQALSEQHVQDDVQTIGRRRRGHLDRASRVYAEALVEMGEEAGQIDELADELVQIRSLLDDQPGLAQLFATPALGAAERRGVIERLFKGRISDTLYRFLQVLNGKNRLASLPTILDAFDAIVAERRGIVEVDVYVAQRLNPAQAQAVARRIGQSLNKEVVLHQYVNPDLIGGLVIRVGDQLIDGSVATQLSTLRQKLVEAGRARARNQNL